MALVLGAIVCFLGAVVINHIISNPSQLWTILILGLIVLVIELLLSLSKIYNLAVEFVVARSMQDQVVAADSSEVLNNTKAVKDTFVDSEAKEQKLESAFDTQSVHCENDTLAFERNANDAQDFDSDVIVTLRPQDAADTMYDECIKFALNKPIDTICDLHIHSLSNAESIPAPAESETGLSVLREVRPHQDPAFRSCHAVLESANLSEHEQSVQLAPRVLTTQPTPSSQNVCESEAVSEAERSAKLAEKELLELLEAEDSKSPCLKSQRPAATKGSSTAKRSKAKKGKVTAKDDVSAHGAPSFPTKTSDDVQSPPTKTLKTCKASRSSQGKAGRSKQVQEDHNSAFGLENKASQSSQAVIDVLSAVSESNNLNARKTRSTVEDDAGDNACEEPYHAAVGCGPWKMQNELDASTQAVTLVPNAKTLATLEASEGTRTRLKNSMRQSVTAPQRRSSKECIVLSEIGARLPGATSHQDVGSPTPCQTPATIAPATAGDSEMNNDAVLRPAVNETNQKQELQPDQVLPGISPEGSILAAVLRAKFPEATVLSCGATVNGSSQGYDVQDHSYDESRKSLWQSGGSHAGSIAEPSKLAAELPVRFPPASSQDGMRVVEEQLANDSSCHGPVQELPQPNSSTDLNNFENNQVLPRSKQLLAGTSSGSMLAAELAAQFPGATIHVGLPPTSMTTEAFCNADDGRSDHRSSSSTSSTTEPSVSASSARESLSSFSSCPPQPLDTCQNEIHSHCATEAVKHQPCSSHLWIDRSFSNRTDSHCVPANLLFAMPASQGVVPSGAPSVSEIEAQTRGAQWRAQLQRKGEQQLCQVKEDLRLKEDSQCVPGMANLEALSQGFQRRAELQQRGKQQMREVEEELLHRYGAEGWLWGQGISLSDHNSNGVDAMGANQSSSLLHGLQDVRGTQFFKQELGVVESHHCGSVEEELDGNTHRPFDGEEQAPNRHQLVEGQESLLKGLKSVKGTSLCDSTDRLASSKEEALQPRLVELAKELCIESDTHRSIPCSMPSSSTSLSIGKESTSGPGLAALMGPSLAEAWTSHNDSHYHDFGGAQAWEMSGCLSMQCSNVEVPAPAEYWQNVGVCLFQPALVDAHVPESGASRFDVAGDDDVRIVGYQAACHETQAIPGLQASAAELEAAVPDHYED